MTNSSSNERTTSIKILAATKVEPSCELRIISFSPIMKGTTVEIVILLSEPVISNPLSVISNLKLDKIGISAFGGIALLTRVNPFINASLSIVNLIIIYFSL